MILARPIRLNIKTCWNHWKRRLFPRTSELRDCKSSSHLVTGRLPTQCWNQREESKVKIWNRFQKSSFRHHIQLCLGMDSLYLGELINSLCSITHSSWKYNLWILCKPLLLILYKIITFTIPWCSLNPFLHLSFFPKHLCNTLQALLICLIYFLSPQLISIKAELRPTCS